MGSSYKVKDKKVYKWDDLTVDEWVNHDEDMLEKSRTWFESNKDVNSQQIMNHICEMYYNKRESIFKHYYIKMNSIPYFDKNLQKMKTRLKKLRKMKYSKNNSENFDIVKYNTLRNKYRNEVRKKRNKYIKDLRNKVVNSDTPKKIVDNIKFLGKNKNDIPIIINSENGKIPKSTEESLNNLNKDFVNVCHSQRQDDYNMDFISRKKREVQNYLSNMRIGNTEWKNMVESYNITPDEIMKTIKDYKKTSAGPDGISIDILQNLINWSTFVVFKLVIQTLIEGKLPKQLKNSNVIPILKKHDENRHVFKNFRPISVTSIVARICEKVILKRIITDVYTAIPDVQYGSRKNMGTTDTLCHLWTEILKNTSLYDETNVVFLDIQKAFDRLLWDLIIWKLKYVCNISDPIVRWIYDFLSDRRQRVKCWGSFSNWMKLIGGGPQGAVLLPVLFTLYISDIPLDNMNHINKERGIKYVDDIALYSTGQFNKQIEDLNERLLKIYQWSNQWGVDFGVHKCKSITFKKKERPKYERNLVFGKEIIENVLLFKYLGVWLNGDMTFKKHIQKKIITCNIETNQLTKVMKKVKSGKRVFARIFWKTKIIPILEYASEVWSLDLDALDLVENYQIKYVRQMYNYGGRSCKPAMLFDMSFVKIGLRICSNREKYVIKCKLKMIPNRINWLFEHKLPVRYSKKVYRDHSLNNDTGYPNVKKYRGKKTYVSSVEYLDNGVKRNKNFLSDYAIVSEKERIFWINKNFNKWYDVRKPVENIFEFDKLKEKNHYTTLITDQNLDHWRRIYDGNIKLLWLYIKKILKKRTKLTQEKLWINMNVGKILRTFKQSWYLDDIINNVEDPTSYILKRMRIGNSSLRGHYGDGSSTVCGNCQENVIESNEHYLMKCQRYRNEREEMMNEIKRLINQDVDLKILLGFFPFELSKRMTTKQKISVIKCVLSYIKKTKRFN